MSTQLSRCVTDMRYFEFDPAPQLAAHVSSYWGMIVGPEIQAGYQHQLLPIGSAVIAAGRAANGAVRASLVGPRVEPLAVTVNPGDRMWGVRFWPDTTQLFFGAVLGNLHGRMIAPLTEPAWAVSLVRSLLSCADEATAAAAADAQLGPVVGTAGALDPVVRAAVVGLTATHGELEIRELADDVGLSQRQLERRFRAAVGLTPKQFARIRRMRSALAHLIEPRARTWSEVAADFGYADHAHLTRDFTQLAGQSPSEIADRVRAITHGRIRP